MSESTPESTEVVATPVTTDASQAKDAVEVPEQTDNSARPEDGPQDEVPQGAEPVDSHPGGGQQ